MFIETPKQTLFSLVETICDYSTQPKIRENNKNNWLTGTSRQANTLVINQTKHLIIVQIIVLTYNSVKEIRMIDVMEILQ